MAIKSFENRQKAEDHIARIPGNDPRLVFQDLSPDLDAPEEWMVVTDAHIFPKLAEIARNRAQTSGKANQRFSVDYTHTGPSHVLDVLSLATEGAKVLTKEPASRKKRKNILTL